MSFMNGFQKTAAGKLYREAALRAASKGGKAGTIKRVMENHNQNLHKLIGASPEQHAKNPGKYAQISRHADVRGDALEHLHNLTPSWMKKKAAFDHNNSGQEFKMSDMGTGNTGAGGMAPSGIPSYQPFENNEKGGGQKMSLKARVRAVISALYKSAGSDIASGGVDQLKYTSQNGPGLEQEADDRQEQKNRRKAYLKSRVRE